MLTMMHTKQKSKEGLISKIMWMVSCRCDWVVSPNYKYLFPACTLGANPVSRYSHLKVRLAVEYSTWMVDQPTPPPHIHVTFLTVAMESSLLVLLLFCVHVIL